MRPRGTCRLFASLAPARLIRIALDISEAMRYCHSLKPEALAHRDLKSVNIVVSEDGRAKVTDFGVAKFLRGTATTHAMQGTLQYAAPEMFGESSDWDWLPCDVYSFGVILWELFSNKRPWENMSDAQIIRSAVTGRGLGPVSGASGSAEVRALIAECLSLDPAARPTFILLCDRLCVQGLPFHLQSQTSFSRCYNWCVLINHL